MTSATRRRAQARVGRSGRAALRLIACCPRIPTDVVATLLRLRHARSAAQLLRRLATAGLAHYETAKPGPLVESRALRLWSLTPVGQAMVAARGLAPLEEGHDLLPYGRPARRHYVARQRDVPMLVVAYRLLAHVVRDMGQPVVVVGWEHPWMRRVSQRDAGRARQVRLPAAAMLTPDGVGGGQARPLLLLPDLGTLPVGSYRPVLRGLVELRQASNADPTSEPLLIVGVAAGSAARVAAWHALLEQVARRTGEPPLHARVVAWPRGLVARGADHRRRGDQAEQLFGLVARHPSLTLGQLAVLLGTSERRGGQLVARLAAHGWVRTLQSDGVRRDAFGLDHSQQRRVVLVELTPAGRREAARRLLPATAAARHHGLLGKDASTRQFLRHLAHTLGANAVFVALASAARRVSERGGDDALEEWRSAAACARGRFRPDGYGCYRRGPSRFGFFLEFDRGTERPGQLAAKLAACYRYRDSGASRRAYETFPTVLLVTTGEMAEARFADQAALASQHHAGAPLRVLVTTTGRIQAHPEGVLGPIWRTPGGPGAAQDPPRGHWLPGGSRRRLFGVGRGQAPPPRLAAVATGRRTSTSMPAQEPTHHLHLPREART